MRQIHGGDVYRNRNVVDFSSNINPLGTPKGVMEAAGESMERIADYPDINCEHLKEALGQKEEIPCEWLTIGNGAAELIFSLALAVKPQNALILAPTFLEYEQALRAVECKVSYYKLKKEQNFVCGEDILESITSDIDIVFLCNPNNPTGEVISGELLLSVLKACEQNGTLLAVDECFMDFLQDKDSFSMKPYMKKYKNLFLLKAFTKLYGMAGIRLGYGMCGDVGLLEKIRAVTQPWNTSTPAQAAGLAALKAREHVKQGLGIVHSQRPVLISGLERLGYRVYGSRANYIFFEGAPGLYEKALAGGFLIRDCSNYPGLCEGFYRIAVKTKEENERFLTWLNQL